MSWTCHLMKSSPRYENWREILQSDEAPIRNPVPIKAIFGAEIAEIFRLDIAKLTADQRSRLIAFMVQKFNIAEATALAELEVNGFPIRAEDVCVAFDLRFFM